MVVNCAVTVFISPVNLLPCMSAAVVNDAGTADLFTEVSRGIDKWLWFVETHSQAAK